MTTKPVCAICNDTHRMVHREREVMCTHCPVPCEWCGIGPFCRVTPCGCDCHKPALHPVAAGARRGATLGALAPARSARGTREPPTLLEEHMTNTPTLTMADRLASALMNVNPEAHTEHGLRQLCGDAANHLHVLEPAELGGPTPHPLPWPQHAANARQLVTMALRQVELAIEEASAAGELLEARSLLADALARLGTPAPRTR